MKRNIKSNILRIMILFSALVLMMLLCGCRTRITNNTEVVGVVHDESGMLQESYQVRRDELGIPVAEPPLFMGSESEDEDYDYDDYDDSYDDFDTNTQEDPAGNEDINEQEEKDKENTSNNTTTNTTTNNTTNKTKTGTTPVKKPVKKPVSKPSATKTTQVKVTLDVNGEGAKCSKKTLVVKKNSTYGVLPTPTRSGYDFDGWYTAKEKGSQVTAKTKVTSSKAHTLYAHWKEIEAKTYTITFDGNGDGDNVELSSTEITVKEGGKYESMPSAKREKYKFTGWFTEPTGGKQVKSGTKFTANEDQTLYAQWEEDLYNWYNNEFSIAANDIPESVDVVIYDGNDTSKKKVIEACKGNITKDVTDDSIVIRFLEGYTEKKATEEAEKIHDELNKTPEGGGSEEEGAGEEGAGEEGAVEEINPTIIVISSGAANGSDEEKLVYKIALLDALHGGVSGMDYETIADELHLTIEIPPLVTYP